MNTYFTISTGAIKAIDNVTIYGQSVYAPTDIMRLISAHAKYPYVLTFHTKKVSKEHMGLKRVLDTLDNMVLHEKRITYNDVFDRYDSIIMNPTAAYESDGYYHLDFSGGEFKNLKIDRTAMLAENRRVYEAMEFLFKHDCEFEYEGSRAKLRIPIKHFSNRHLIYYKNNHIRGWKLETKLECGVYHTVKTEEIVEVETL